jgi:hypothetical protein
MIHFVFVLFLFIFSSVLASEDSFAGLYEHAYFRWFICMTPQELYDGAKEVQALEARLPRALETLNDLKFDVALLRKQALENCYSLYDPKDPRWVVQAHALCSRVQERKKQLGLLTPRS